MHGPLVKAKLLVPSQFANDLIGNREAIIASGADVHIPIGDQVLDCISENELLIEVSARVFACNHYAMRLTEILLLFDSLIVVCRLWESIGMYRRPCLM